jgi:hypothetical protein
MYLSVKFLVSPPPLSLFVDYVLGYVLLTKLYVENLELLVVCGRLETTRVRSTLDDILLHTFLYRQGVLMTKSAGRQRRHHRMSIPAKTFVNRLYS